MTWSTNDATLAAMKSAGPVSKVLISNDKTVLYVRAGSRWFELEVEGDCCSSTWIESIENLDALIGRQIVGIEEVQMGEPSEEEYAKHKEVYGYDGDSLEDYAMKLVTGAGITTIIYRNSSNGYYGGSAGWRELSTEAEWAPEQDVAREVVDDF